MLDEAHVDMKTVMPKLATISVDKPRQISVGVKANAVKQLRTKLGMSRRVEAKYIFILSNGCAHARMLQMADVGPQNWALNAGFLQSPKESDVTLGSYQVVDRWAKLMGITMNHGKATIHGVAGCRPGNLQHQNMHHSNAKQRKSKEAVHAIA